MAKDREAAHELAALLVRNAELREALRLCAEQLETVNEIFFAKRIREILESKQ